MTDVYVARTDILKEPQIFQVFYESAPVFRKEKIDRLQNAEKKRTSLGAWVLLAHALRQAGSGCDALDLSFTKTGKPYLAKFPHIHFSLSHSADVVLCAVSDSEVGCDVEQVRRVDLKLANRFFSPPECRFIETQEAPESGAQMFFRLWTLKESYIKATGQTLSALPDFSIIFEDDKIYARQHVAQNKEFYFKEFSLHDGNCYACCAERDDFSELKIVNFEDM